MERLTLSRFFGVVSALADDDIPPEYASDSQDARLEDGNISNRYGWQNVNARTSTAQYLLNFHQTIDENGTTQEGYVTVETIGGNTNPWEGDPTSGDRTAEITTSAPASLSLHASAWASTSFADYTYFWNNNDTTNPLWRYKTGDVDTAEVIKPPEDPTVPITLEFIKDIPNNDTGNYTKVGWASSTVVLDGSVATSESEDGDDLLVEHGGTGTATVTITPSATKDWTYNDTLLFTITNEDFGGRKFVWRPSTLKAEVINGDPETQELELIAIEGDGRPGHVTAAFKYPKDYDRTKKDDVTKIAFTYDIIIHSGKNTTAVLRFAPVEVGCIHPEYWQLGVLAKMYFSYYWRNSTTEDVSDYVIPFMVADHTRFSGDFRAVNGVGVPMGVAPRVTATATAQSGVDYWGLVVSRNDDPDERRHGEGPVRIVGTFLDASALSQYYSDDLDTHITRDKYSELSKTGGLNVTEILCATAHRGHMVWGVKGGTSNIRHAGPDSPMQVHNVDAGLLGEYEWEPQDYTLSDDGADDPIAMHSIGESLIVLGNRRAYAQGGTHASRMTYFKTVPKSNGIAGRNASASWASDDGQAGVVYLSKDFDTVLFVRTSPLFDGTDGYSVTVLNKDITGKIKSFLGISNPTTDDINVSVDPISDSLWITYHDKACVFRSPSIADGRRHWEFYDYTITGDWSYWNFSQDYGIRAIRSTGHFDEVEYDNSSNKDPIVGANRDGGNAVTGWWESKNFHAPGTRLLHAWIERDTITDTPTIEVTSKRATTSKTVTASENRVKFPATQQGPRHKVKITLGDNSSPVSTVDLTFTPAGDRPGL